MEVIKLNLIPGKACPVVHASQFDDGRDFKAELYEGVNVYTLDGTETLTAIVKKPDGNEVTVAVTNTSDNYVIITTTEQMTACAGGNLGTLRIEKGAVTIATLNFILECQASPDTGIQSDSEIHNLEAQVNQMVEDAVAEQYDSNNVLFDTAPTSGHGVPYAVTSGGLWSWLRDLPLRAYPTASGAIATFDTSLALPLQDLQIAINAVQESGTPTPSSPKLISGFTGANIVNHGKNYLDTSTNVNGKALSATGVETSVPAACYTDLIKVVGGEKYTFGATSAIVDAWNRRIHGYDESGNWVQEIMNSNAQSYAVGTPFTMTFAIPNGISYIRISYYKDTNAQLEKGEIASAYQAYNSTTTAITWQSEAGTVYGGSYRSSDKKLIVNRSRQDLKDLGWSLQSQDTNVAVFVNGYIATQMDNANVVSNCLSQSIPSGTAGRMVVGGNNFYVALPKSELGSLDESGAKQWFEDNNCFILYYTKTPTEYTITGAPPTPSAIVGTNNVFTDTNGNTSVVYACSLKDYIDGQ